MNYQKALTKLSHISRESLRQGEAGLQTTLHTQRGLNKLTWGRRYEDQVEEEMGDFTDFETVGLI